MARWVKLLAAKPGHLSLIPGRQGEHCGGTDQTSVSCPLTSLLTVKHTGPQAQTHKKEVPQNFNNTHINKHTYIPLI